MAINYDGGAIKSTLTSESDLSSSQYTFVIQGTADLTCKSPADANSEPIGVVANKPSANQAAMVVHAGVTQVKLGDTVARGALLKLTADTTGRVQTATPASGATFTIVGRALESGSANEIITALVGCLNSGNHEA
tara:strand:- start:343 stop:747 length:405 start_codon:yes stop_codon:yes gene_type:complete